MEEDEFAFYLNILNRLGFMGYWFFDNLQVLSKINFLKLDSAKNGKIASLFWFFALIFALILDMRNFVRYTEDQAQIERLLINCREDEVDVRRNQLRLAKKAKKDCVLNIIKYFGDLITASQGSEIAPKLLKITFNDGWIGIGGFISAMITSYQLF